MLLWVVDVLNQDLQDWKDFQDSGLGVLCAFGCNWPFPFVSSIS